MLVFKFSFFKTNNKWENTWDKNINLKECQVSGISKLEQFQGIG